MQELSDAAKRLNVLCLDPDRQWLRILSRELRTAGINDVQTANDPKTALCHIQSNPVDLVVTGHNLKFVKFLRQHDASPNRELPVIMLTNKVGPEEIFAIRDAGVNEIAVKPCSASQMIQRIEAVASHPRQFVWSNSFAGPDRRRKDSGFAGPERREEED